MLGAGGGVVGLDLFYAVGLCGSEAVFRPGKALIGMVDVLLRNCHLFFGCVEIEKGRPHVIVNLPANVFRFGLTLAQFGLSLRDITFDPTAGEERNLDPRLKSEISVRVAKRWPNVALVTINSHS